MAGTCFEKASSKLRVAMTRRALAVLFAAAMAQGLWGQVFKLTKEQMVQYTPGNPYERFPDGRPKVPDAILEKVKGMSAEEVLGLNQRGYRNQYEAGWQILHPDVKMVGRAVTL